MKTFRSKIKDATGLAKIEEYRTRYNLALAGLESLSEEIEKPCYALYVAISHLAEIPELGILIGMYDNLLFSMNQQYDKETVRFVQTKLDELSKIIEEMETNYFEQR